MSNKQSTKKGTPATAGNAQAGHPERERNEIAGPDQAQPPSGLRPDLDTSKDNNSDGAGVGKSM